MSHRERNLSIMYDLAATIGSEVSLKPLLTKVLQRFIFHTGFPAGMVLLKPGFNMPPHSTTLILASSIGDTETAKHHEEAIEVDHTCLKGRPTLMENTSLHVGLPCRQDYYRTVFCLPVPETGAIVLLSPNAMEHHHINTHLFTPLLGNLAKAIELCRISDHQTKQLTREMQERTDALHESEEYIRLLLASTAEAIYGVDTDGCCTFANASFLKLLGYQHLDEVLHQPIHTLIHHSYPDGRPFPVEDCSANKAYKNGLKITSETDVFWKKDGTPLDVAFSVYPIISKGKHIGSVASFQDITQKLALIKEKDELRRHAESAQRLESLGILAGGIAHDFNNILTAIMGNAGLAQKRLGDHPVATDFIAPIIDASQSAADLCRQMLAYSGKGRFVVKPVNLSEVVRYMTKLLEVSIGKQVTLHYSLNEQLPAVRVDISQIQQVIMNLITNANEAIGDQQGTISLVTGTQKVTAQYLKLLQCQNELPEGDYVFLEVSDNGCGIAPEIRDKIFEPFFTTKQFGRGLGMSAMQGIIHGHGGTIKLYSEPGQGSSFKILLPVSAEQTVPISTPVASKHLPQVSGTILVVDDDDAVREAVVAMLEDMGFHVVEACDGQQALNIYNEHAEQFAAVILDMSMPVMSGEQCFRELRTRNPAVQVILSSGYNEQELSQRFVGKGLAGFLQKPYMPEALEKKLHEILS